MGSRSGRRGLPMRTTTKYTLNMYGSETLGARISLHWAPRRPWRDLRFTVYMYVEQRLRWYSEAGGGVVNTLPKSGSLFAWHTDRLSFIDIDMSLNMSKRTLLFGDQSLYYARSYDAASFLPVVCEIAVLYWQNILFALALMQYLVAIWATNQPVTDISNFHSSA